MERFNILVVDDEQEFRELMVKRLLKQGFMASGAQSGEEALQMLSKTIDRDVVLLDVKMQGMDGIETLRQIRGQFPLVEVVLLTGHASVESGIEGMKLGAFDYLMKPIELEPLIEKLTAAYRKKREHEARIEEARNRQFLAMPI